MGDLDRARSRGYGAPPASSEARPGGPPLRRALDWIRDFLRLEAAGGLLLLGAAALALLAANSPLAHLYERLLDTPFEIRLGSLALAKPLLLWIDDGLMAVFFLLVGLEIKREILEGELSSWNQASLPLFAAIGGMLAPALVYSLVNAGHPETAGGWAIPAATDIAFALGILSLAGKGVSSSLKVFLLALAIIDDLGAIVIIAVLYTSDLSLVSLVLAGVGLGGLFVLNRRGVVRIAPYMLVGVFIWVCVLESGVHATLAGVAVAFFIPLRTKGDAPSPLRHLERALHPWVAFGIMPLFAFANAGVSFAGMSLSSFAAPLPLGIAAGLFVGKQLGVFGASFLVVKIGLCRLPEAVRWRQLYGVALLTGIGFTMSLFIGSLAFESAHLEGPVRVGVLSGTLLSALAGSGVLWLVTRRGGDADPAPA